MTYHQRLKSLQRTWYKKLEKEGFHDIEKGGFLKEWDSQYFQARYTPDIFSIKQTYFMMASEFLQTYPFSSQLEKTIWSLHTEGMSYRQIASSLKNKNLHLTFCTPKQCDLFCPCSLDREFISSSISKDSVNQAVLRLKDIMLRTLKTIVSGEEDG